MDKLDIDKQKNMLSNFINLKSKVDKLEIDKLVPVPVHLSKVSDVLKNDDAKKDVCNAKIKNIEEKIPDITNLAINASLKAKINEVKGEIPNITNLDTNASLNANINEIKNKIPNITNLAATTAPTAVESKTPDHSKYITTPEFNKLTAESFSARLKHANLATKADITDFIKKERFR